MVLTIAEYEEQRYERSRKCRERCGIAGRKVHEWCDESGAISEEEAIENLHRVSNIESAGRPHDAAHYIFRLNADGSVTYLETHHAGQGFMPFGSQKHQDALACLCCKHDLKVVG